MKSTLRNLFSSENAGEVVAFLRGRGSHAHIIAPEWVRERVLMSGAAAETQASWSEDVEHARGLGGEKTNCIVVAEDASIEQNLVNAVKKRPEIRAFGLFRHVFPALLCGANGMAAGLPVDDLRHYALICVPRSGSRYLAAVLSNRGVGTPREHLRAPFAQLIAQGGLGFASGMTALERFGQRNGIFGTKLISTFLIMASHRRLTELTGNIAWMADRGYRFIRLERPLAETVVSSYIAFLMSRWHFFGELDEASRAKLDSLVFNGGAALDEYIRFRAEQIIVDAIAAPVRRPQSPIPISRKISTGLSHASVRSSASTRSRRPKERRAYRCRRAWLRRPMRILRADWPRPLWNGKDDLVPRTIRRLRNPDRSPGSAAAEKLMAQVEA